MFWNSATRWAACKLNQLTSHVPPPPRDPEDGTPRRILLVHAHPRSDSFSNALADAVVAGAAEGGHEIRRRSLYAEGYRPELTGAERGSYFETAKGALRLASPVRSHLQDLRWADSLIFVYPTWWFNMPAMLKGFFDRTFVPGSDCAWDFPCSPEEKAASNGLVPKLTNIKRMMGVSTYGAPQHIAFLAGDNGRNCISTAIRPNFDPSCTIMWLGLYRMDDCSADERQAFLTRVRRAVKDEF
jgi:NAD(P)H dehydrogenase (quinone)